MVLLLAVGVVSAGQGTRSGAKPVTFAAVRRMALNLSHEPYAGEPPNLPASLKTLDYSQYRAIQYRRDKAVWRGQDLPFQLEFFMRGYLYKQQVDMALVEDGRVVPVAFKPELFHYQKNRPAGLGHVSGFAGLRILYRSGAGKRYRGVGSFLGASYFRAVYLGGVTGSSARGIAVDTSVAGQEEQFPAFTKFWIVRPQRHDRQLVVYALLEGHSLTGAYRFTIRPGQKTVILVQESLFMRKSVTALGLAPLTSMFLYGADRNAGPARVDKRPQVHDSDGLLLETGHGEWIWRPLHNPMHNRFSSFGVGGQLKGFGLMQRACRARDYDDTGAQPEKRPSIWVQPVGNWPAGRVDLYEISTASDNMDNIVAQYVIDRQIQPGMRFNVRYRLTWFCDKTSLYPQARVARTLRKIQPDGTLACTIYFSGEPLSETPSTQISPLVTANGGQVGGIALSKQAGGDYRLTFDVTSENRGSIIELRASLHIGAKTISEIWSDQWKP